MSGNLWTDELCERLGDRERRYIFVTSKKGKKERSQDPAISSITSRSYCTRRNGYTF